MKTITLAIEETVLDEVREIAARRRTTVNAMLREYLTQVAGEEGRIVQARKRLQTLMDRSTGSLDPTYTWNREDLYAERLLPRHKHLRLRGDRETDSS